MGHQTEGHETEPALMAAALRRVPLLAALGEEERAALGRAARRQRYDADEVVFSQGDPGTAAYVILSGQVKVAVMSPEGREVILALLDDGESFGELALLDDLPRSATIQAARATEVVVLHKADFHRLIRESTEIATTLLQVMAKRLRGTDVLIEDAAFLSAPERLAKRLLLLMESHGRPVVAGGLPGVAAAAAAGAATAIEIDVDLTQGELASLIGTSRETVNKQLGLFRDQGILVQERQRIIILDPAALRARTVIQLHHARPPEAEARSE